MLVLTRMIQESVVIGARDGLEQLVRVTVLGIENERVRLGFEAPGDLPVHRSEVWERIHGNLPPSDVALARQPPLGIAIDAG